MLAPDGRLAYSTCSLNPLENEAVVAGAILTLGGAAAFEVMVLPNMEGLGVCPGLTTWRVANPEHKVGWCFLPGGGCCRYS